MHFQLTHEDERTWAMMLKQLAENQIETIAPGWIRKLKQATGTCIGVSKKPGK